MGASSLFRRREPRFVILRATLRILLLRGARSTLYVYCPYMDTGRLKAGLHRNAFISYPSRLGVHLVEPAFRTITRARSIRSI